MLISMTGFGRAQCALPGFGRADIEIRCVNHRYLEMEFRLPEGWEFLEKEIRNTVTGRIHRGRVRVAVGIKKEKRKAMARIQEDVARGYADSLRKLAGQLKISPQVNLEAILALPQVVVFEAGLIPGPREAKRVLGTLREVVEKTDLSRRREGSRLGGHIRKISQKIAQLRGAIERRKSLSERERSARLSVRASKIFKGQIKEQAIAQAAVALVEESDVSEELARIASHLAALKTVLSGRGENAGRTIDFLAQELHREANTVGSKAQDAAITRWVIDMKNQIEKIREQAANVE